MADKPPIIYILNGEDEFAISSFLTAIRARMGDSATAEMNTSRLDGQNYSMDVLTNAVSAMPFLTPRRLVILTNPLVKLNNPTLREKFIALLERIPPTTALVLVEYKLLTEDRDRRNQKIHWLETWAHQAGERALFRTFSLPHGDMMVRWIQDRAKYHGGEFKEEAAERLAALVGDEPRWLEQEIRKILEYVNYERPVIPEDVEYLTPYSRQGDIFAMVDNLATGKVREAQEMLHRLLEEGDAILIFGMVVRQFRLLLLTRDVLDRGGRESDVIREFKKFKISTFVAKKMVPQAHLFTMETLEAIYHRLLVFDEGNKTSQIEVDLALDLLMISLIG